MYVPVLVLVLIFLLGVLSSIPFSGVLQINPISVSMTASSMCYAGYNSPNLLGYITID